MKSNYKALGIFIEPVSQLNEDMEVKELLGISNQKFFQNSHTNTIDIDLQAYRIVRTNQFAYNRATTRNGDKISIALRQGNDCIVSPSYRVFKSKDENVLNSEYLMMWFRRPEFDRYARFKSHGSAHEFFEFDQMCQVELPVPHIDKQREIVKEYNIIQNRVLLNQQLIRKLEETSQGIYKEWFVEGIDLERLPDGWRAGKLEEIKHSTLGGDWGKDILIDNYNKEVFCVRGTDIPTSNFGQVGNLPTRFILSKNLLNRKLEPYDIVIEISGGSPTQSTGRSVLLTSEYLDYLNKDVICSNFCRVIKAKEHFSIFLFSSIVHLYNSNVLFTYENSSNGVKNLAIDDLFKEKIIPIPNTGTLNLYNNYFLKIYRHIGILGREIEKLTELKELLLSKLAAIK